MNLNEMLISAIDNFGTSDIITIMLSQKLDKKIAKEQGDIFNEYKSRNC